MTYKPRKVLYYPNIEPNIEWLKRVLLVTDHIVRIVPEDLTHGTNPEFQRFCDILPDAISDTQPIDADIKLDEYEMGRLNQAFEMIAASSHQASNMETAIIIGENGSLHIEGHSLLHYSKFSRQIGDLLKHHKLLLPEMDSLAKTIAYDNFGVVDRKAGNLIMSKLADKIARRKMWNTITDNSPGFTMNSLDALEKSTDKPIHSAIAEYLIEVAIPKNVSDLDFNSYKILRNSYSDIRKLFQKVTHDIIMDPRN